MTEHVSAGERSPARSPESRPSRRGWSWIRNQKTAFRVRYIILKLASAVLVMWLAVTIAFIALTFAPSDPVTLLLGDAANEAAKEAARAQWGLDRPLWQQYLGYLWQVLHGDLGYSYVKGDGVSNILFGKRLVASTQLALLAFAVAIVLSTVSALVFSGRRGTVSTLVQFLELTFASTPAFWLGLVLIWIFAFTLKLLPVASGSELQRLVLPAVTLALPIAAVLAQVLREGMEKALQQPFSITARARGISHSALKRRHAFRHSLLPATTLAGWAVSGLLTGTVVVEKVFGRTGIGQATVEAVLFQDIPVVLGVALIAAFVYTVVNTIVDILYLWIDPRLREAGR